MLSLNGLAQEVTKDDAAKIQAEADKLKTGTKTLNFIGLIPTMNF